MQNSLRLNSLQSWSVRTVSATLIAVLVIVFGSLIFVSSDVALGGLISEKLLGRSGTTNSSMLLGSATSATESVLGFAPVVSTSVVGATSAAGATLRGHVTNMNGMPTATGYFQWGYAAGALTNTTTTFAVTGTGNYGLTITGFNANDEVFYRFVTDADGTAYGAVTSFVVASGVGGWMIKTLLRIILACVILIGVAIVGMRGGMTGLLMSGIIGLLAFIIINELITRIL